MRVDSSRAHGAIVLALLVAACSGAPSEVSEQRDQAPDNTAAVAQPEAPRIECAAPGSTQFAPACTVDRAETPDGVILTLRRPDGAFHRLQITRDGRGVIAADGAEPPKVTPIAADRIEVELGGARYRLPATIRQ